MPKQQDLCSVGKTDPFCQPGGTLPDSNCETSGRLPLHILCRQDMMNGFIKTCGFNVVCHDIGNVLPTCVDSFLRRSWQFVCTCSGACLDIKRPLAETLFKKGVQDPPALAWTLHTDMRASYLLLRVPPALKKARISESRRQPCGASLAIEPLKERTAKLPFLTSGSCVTAFRQSSAELM